MLSPAQPSAQPSWKKMHHFLLRFSPKIFEDREIMLFENRKNKIVFGPNIFNGTYQKCLFWFRVFSIKVSAFLQMHSWEFKYPRRHFALGSISFSMKINDFWWFFDVFRVLPEPLQDRRVDFLTLNFDEKASIFACFSGAFWSIAKPACWFFDAQFCFLFLRAASGSSTPRTT